MGQNGWMQTQWISRQFTADRVPQNLTCVPLGIRFAVKAHGHFPGGRICQRVWVCETCLDQTYSRTTILPSRRVYR